MFPGAHAAMLSSSNTCYPVVILVIRCYPFNPADILAIRLLPLLSGCYSCYPAVVLVIRLLSFVIRLLSLSDCYPCYPMLLSLSGYPCYPVVTRPLSLLSYYPVHVISASITP